MNFNQQHSIQQLKLHFKQWSNKSYAAFCSIGKVVHIDNLAVSLTQWIGDVVELVEVTIQACIDQEEDECTDGLMEQENLQVLPVVVSTEVEKGRKIRSNINNINCR